MLFLRFLYNLVKMSIVSPRKKNKFSKYVDHGCLVWYPRKESNFLIFRNWESKRIIICTRAHDVHLMCNRTIEHHQPKCMSCHKAIVVITGILKTLNFMARFYGWGSTASRLSHFEEAVYFLPLSSQKFLVLILLTSEGWKTELTLEPLNGFERRTSGLGIQHLNH